MAVAFVVRGAGVRRLTARADRLRGYSPRRVRYPGRPQARCADRITNLISTVNDPRPSRRRSGAPPADSAVGKRRRDDEHHQGEQWVQGADPLHGAGEDHLDGPDRHQGQG